MSLEFGTCLGSGAIEGGRNALFRTPLAADCQIHRRRVLGFELNPELGTLTAQLVWTRRELQDCVADDLIQPSVSQRKPIAIEHGHKILSPRMPRQATNLVDVGEVRADVERQGRTDGLYTVVLNSDLLIQSPVQEKFPDSQMQRSQRKIHRSVPA